MQPSRDSGVHLDTFDRPVADAVVTVLRRHGVPAWTADAGGGLPGLERDEAAVYVAEGSREVAFATLSGAMEEVRETAEQSPRLVRPRGLGTPRSPITDEPGPPIVMERIRRMGFVALLLAPLLVITLAAPGMPMTLALIVYVGGLVLLTAWRRRDPDQQP